MATSSIKKNGILNGGIIGFAYIILIYIASSITGSGFALNIYSIIMMAVGIIAGMIGGVVRSKFEIIANVKSGRWGTVLNDRNLKE